MIDTGGDLGHQQLKNKLWVNPGEDGLDQFGQSKRTNGRDDDGNGFVDDIHGWDFTSNSNKLNDVDGHGTHVAGIVVKQSKTVNVKIMVLKYYDSRKPYQLIKNTIAAINYAVKMGADVINYSSAGPTFSIDEKRAIQKAGQKGVLFITAAGNDSLDLNQNKVFPASYGLNNIVVVGAVDVNGERAPKSNFGKALDLYAPGVNLMSALPGGKSGMMSGTSQATAVVTGIMVELFGR